MITIQQIERFLKTRTVLYVEHDDEIRERHARHLEGRVGRLVTAYNGYSGLEAFREHGPDMIIMDLEMPGLNGLDLVQVIRAKDRNVPIIVTMAVEESRYLIRAIELGVDKYVKEQVEPKKLYTTMLQLGRILYADHLVTTAAELARHSQEVRNIATTAGSVAQGFNGLHKVIMHNITYVLNDSFPDSDFSRRLQHAYAACESAMRLEGNLLKLASEGAVRDPGGYLSAV